jgi:hypothetical protein
VGFSTLIPTESDSVCYFTQLFNLWKVLSSHKCTVDSINEPLCFQLTLQEAGSDRANTVSSTTNIFNLVPQSSSAVLCGAVRWAAAIFGIDDFEV